MLKKLFDRRSSVLEATAVLAVASLVSRIFGVIRESLIASHFGASDITDAYKTAFVIPDFIFNLLILGALSSAFIPIFTDYLQKNGTDKEEAWNWVNSLINIGVVILAVVLLLATIFAPTLAGLIGQGFSEDKQEMVAAMMRVMMLSPLFFGLSNLAGGILNSFKNFLAYSLAPILYNLGIIVGVLYLEPMFGFIGLAYGVVLGALLHLLIQLPGVFNLGYRYKMKIDFHHPGLKKMAALMVPRTLGIAVSQVNIVVNTAIASTLGVGSVYVFNLANDLQNLPIGIFGISFAVAVFPTLAEKYSLQKLNEFKQDLVQVMRQIVFFVVPTMVLFWLLRAQIVRLVFGYGEFGWDATRFTISALAFFTFGILAQSLIHLLARSFYALHDTKTPLIASLVSLVVNVTMALILVKYLNVVGLAAAVSIAATVNMLILLFFLSRKLSGLPWGEIANIAAKISFAAVVMGGAGYLMLRVMNLIVSTGTVRGLLIQTLVTIVVAGLTYLAVAKIIKIPEVETLVRPLRFLIPNRLRGQVENKN